MLRVASCVISGYSEISQKGTGCCPKGAEPSTLYRKICTLCAPTRQKSQGLISLNIAKTCANKYINVSQLPRKLGYHECLHITVLAVLYCETSEIQITYVILSLVLRHCVVYSKWTMYGAGESFVCYLSSCISI